MKELPMGVVLRFILMVSGETMIGSFDLTADTKKWSFKYVENFNDLTFLPIEEFPEVGHTYGHEACSKWLASRLSSNTTSPNGLHLDESVGIKNIIRRSNLEIFLVH